MIEQLIAEATECDFKVALEIKKPKSQLKSVSSFSNGIGGTLFFGISDDRKPIGLSDVQKDAEAISRLIKERITPLPQFILKPLQEDGKNLLALEVSPGRSTPYYYKADGVMEAYIRVGNESVIAPDVQKWGELTALSFLIINSVCNRNKVDFLFLEHDLRIKAHLQIVTPYPAHILYNNCANAHVR